MQDQLDAGNPLEPLIPNQGGNILAVKRTLEYGDNSKDWAISSREPTSDMVMDMVPVQRLQSDRSKMIS